jgi:hypothetical protein
VLAEGVQDPGMDHLAAAALARRWQRWLGLWMGGLVVERMDRRVAESVEE